MTFSIFVNNFLFVSRKKLVVSCKSFVFPKMFLFHQNVFVSLPIFVSRNKHHFRGTLSSALSDPPASATHLVGVAHSRVLFTGAGFLRVLAAVRTAPSALRTAV